MSVDDLSKNAHKTLKLDKHGRVHFQTPEGFLVDLCLDQPTRKFSSKGIFLAGLHLTTTELFAIEVELRRLFATAFPDETADLHLPFRVREDGTRTLLTKSFYRVDVIDTRHRKLVSVENGSRARIVGKASPYRLNDRCGVALFAKYVQVIDLSPRNPRRESAHRERAALRQAAALARKVAS